MIESIKTPPGVCTRINVNGYQISIAQESSEISTGKIGEEYCKADIRVYRLNDDKDVTQWILDAVYSKDNYMIYGSSKNLFKVSDFLRSL